MDVLTLSLERSVLLEGIRFSDVAFVWSFLDGEGGPSHGSPPRVRVEGAPALFAAWRRACMDAGGDVPSRGAP